jgi:hypothetical protein
VNLLMGRNGAGKSTLLDLLWTLRGLFVEGRGVDALPPAAPGTTARISLTLHDGVSPLTYALVLQRHAPDAERPEGWTMIEEAVRQGERAWVAERGELRVGDDLTLIADDRSFLAGLGFAEGSAPAKLKAWARGLLLLRLEPQRMVNRAETPSPSLMSSGENLVAWLFGRPDRAKGLRRLVRVAAHSMDGLTGLEFERAGRSSVLVARFEDGRMIDFHRLSDGQRCLLALYATLTFTARAVSLLLLDEPDAHVTSAEILPLFTALRALPGDAQVIVASHHPQVIDLLTSDLAVELIWRGAGVVAEPFGAQIPAGVSASEYLLLREET